MKKRWSTLIVLFLAAFFYSFEPAYCKESIITELVCNASEYTVVFENEKALISRDGAEAISIVSGTKLTKPGTYFLTLFDDKDHIKINTFTILPLEDTNIWTITRESELEEILKYCLENFKTDIVVKFNYGQITGEQASNIVSKHLQALVNKYPKLLCEGHSLSTTEGDKPTVKIKPLYPLRVVNTLKAYDAKTNKRLVQVINEKINPEMKDYQRELALYEFIMDNISYSKTKEKGITYINATPLSHTMYGGIIDQIAVCDGYARSLMYLLNSVGVPTRFISGTSEGVGHAWNIVKIQGAYYHVDSTWADQEGDKIGAIHAYFNEKDNYMKKSHTWDEKLYPKAITDTYNILHMTIEMKDIYRIRKKSDVNTVFTSLFKKSPQKATIVLYNDSENKWNQDEMLGRIVKNLGTDIIYWVERKSNCLVISFNKD